MRERAERSRGRVEEPARNPKLRSAKTTDLGKRVGDEKTAIKVRLYVFLLCCLGCSGRVGRVDCIIFHVSLCVLRASTSHDLRIAAASAN